MIKRLITVVLAILLVLVLSACSKEDVSFEDSCWEQVQNCESMVLDDGTVSVTLTAPDYSAIIQHLVENGVTGDVTVEMLDEAAKDNPGSVKEYSFVAESIEEEAIQNALMEQIAYELLIIAMEDVAG